MNNKLSDTQPKARSARSEFLIPDLTTLLLSVALAVAVWWIAINQENPLVVADLEERVPVSVLGLGEELVIVEDISNEAVRLRLRAPRNSWTDLTVSDFRATLDLTDLGAGEHDVAVQVKSLDPQVGILDVQRPQLRVTIDTLAQKEVPVQVEIMDGTAFGYDPQPAVYRPMTVTVSGPTSQVQQVTRARAEVYLRGAKNQVERMEAVTLVDGQNQAITRVTAEPELVQVVVPVEQWPGRKAASRLSHQQLSCKAIQRFCPMFPAMSRPNHWRWTMPLVTCACVSNCCCRRESPPTMAIRLWPRRA
jgi:YbbR domain-containing protein